MTRILRFSVFLYLSSTKNEKLIKQQLLVDQLSEELAKFNLSMTSSDKESCGDGPDARISENRPHTVPFDSHWGHHVYIPSRHDSKKVSQALASALLRSSSYLSYQSVKSWEVFFFLFCFHGHFCMYISF